MYILYGGRFTRSLMVEMVLAEGGLAYEHREIDIDKDEHRAPDFLAVNPAGLVPALITPEGETLTETPAINLTLAERHGLRQLAPGPEEPERGRFLSALFFLTDELEPALKRHFYPQRYVLREEDAPAMAQRAMDDALARFALIEGQLGDAGRALLAVELEEIEPDGLVNRGDGGVALVDEDAHQRRLGVALRGERACVLGRDRARARRIEVQAHHPGPARDRRGHGGVGVDPADLDAD